MTQIHFSPIRLAKIQTVDKFCGEAVRKQALSYIAGNSVIGTTPYGGQFGNTDKKL